MNPAHPPQMLEHAVDPVGRRVIAALLFAGLGAEADTVTAFYRGFPSAGTRMRDVDGSPTADETKAIMRDLESRGWTFPQGADDALCEQTSLLEEIRL